MLLRWHESFSNAVLACGVRMTSSVVSRGSQALAIEWGGAAWFVASQRMPKKRERSQIKTVSNGKPLQ